MLVLLIVIILPQLFYDYVCTMTTVFGALERDAERLYRPCRGPRPRRDGFMILQGFVGCVRS